MLEVLVSLFMQGLIIYSIYSIAQEAFFLIKPDQYMVPAFCG